MTPNNQTLIITLAGVAILGVIVLGMAGRDIPAILADVIQWIIAGSFGGGVVTTANEVLARRREERERELRDKWRHP